MGLTAVIGAQYGSEGKGAVCQWLAPWHGFHVRVGGPNAGHTIVHEGRIWKLQSVPCGFVNPDAQLVIGAGAVVDPDQLLKEIKELDEAGYDVSSRLIVDASATVITGWQRRCEGGTRGRGHEAIGSTGEGVGAARVARINRRGVLGADAGWLQCIQVKDVPALDQFAQHFTASMLQQCSKSRSNRVLLEGTQGAGLSLTHGEWPYVTSADTGAAQLLADTGLPPRDLEEVIMVARTFPIRVAGNSGPLYHETSWEKVGVPPESTTVTKKTRRVGEFDWGQVKESCERNGATGLVVTFLDYLWPEATHTARWEDLPSGARDWLRTLEARTDTPVIAAGVGPSQILSTHDAVLEG